MNDCPQHSGQNNQVNRLVLDTVLRGLPNNQSGAGRHKCAYCAYQIGHTRGYKDAIKHMREQLTALGNINQSPLP